MLVSTELCILCLPCAVSVGHACLGRQPSPYTHNPCRILLSIHMGIRPSMQDPELPDSMLSHRACMAQPSPFPFHFLHFLFFHLFLFLNHVLIIGTICPLILLSKLKSFSQCGCCFWSILSDALTPEFTVNPPKKMHDVRLFHCTLVCILVVCFDLIFWHLCSLESSEICSIACDVHTGQ